MQKYQEKTSSQETRIKNFIKVIKRIKQNTKMKQNEAKALQLKIAKFQKMMKKGNNSSEKKLKKTKKISRSPIK